MARGIVVFATALSCVAALAVMYVHFGAPGSGVPRSMDIRRQMHSADVRDTDAATSNGLMAPAGRICCKALTARCLACSADMSVVSFCNTHPDTVGCEVKTIDNDNEAVPSASPPPPTTPTPTKPAVVRATIPPKGPIADPVVVGHCKGNNYGLLENPAKFALEFAQATFPHRQVVVNELSMECMPTAETKYDHTDMIIIVWSKYDDVHKKGIEQSEESERIRWNADPTPNPRGLLAYQKSRVVRHSRGRTFMIALNDEAYGQSGALYDLMIEAKLEPKYVHRHTSNLWWPIASRFLLQDAWSQSTNKDLIVPANFDADALLKTKTAFCAFRHKACDKGFYKEATGAPTRVALFDALKEHYKPCSSLGTCRADADARSKYNVPAAGEAGARGAKRVAPPGGREFATSSVLTFEPFKFSFAIENSFAEGYWTEKITNGILAKTVPIVAGIHAANETLLSKHINMDRIIYCQMPATVYANAPAFNPSDSEARIKYVKRECANELKACVDKIRKVDEDDTLYKKMVSTPFLKTNTLDENSLFAFPIYGKYLRESLREHESYLMEGEPVEEPDD
eukprot:m.198795 g.198795  ORF g.198795 m.198795 type:complete len:570 (+) comp20545_c0_seq1:294-2003(+)